MYKVNPRERLYTPGVEGYHIEDGQVDEVYQEEELPNSFTIGNGAALNSLVGDHNDINVPQKHKRQPRKKKVTWQSLGRRRLHDRDVDEF